MNLRRNIPSLAMSLLLIACASNPELNKTMISDSTPIPAVEENLGLTFEGDQGVFRIFGPSLDVLHIVFFNEHDAQSGVSYPLKKKDNGIWELRISQTRLPKYYAYQTSPDEPLIADPYSKAVVRQNHYKYPSKTLVVKEAEFDWEGDDFTHANLGDLVILEAHLRDMTVHPSSGGTQAGSYLGFIDPDQKGGINHLVDMGYNAVEFLPLQEFGNIEIDFKNPELTIWNDWNPYENNHWGYMTSFFFTPELYYSSRGTNERGAWMGQDGRTSYEMKSMVKALHKKGISVIVDVVYNHVSQYDDNPFKLIDREAYFRLDASGEYIAASGCGNDFQTEHPMARKMILESLVYWMEEYHVDGFRFDLAAMIDMETVDAITEATRAVNPDVILIGEPWGGGGYNPAELANHDWASWNDVFRNSVKGRHPENNDFGLAFGQLWDGKNLTHYKNLMRGFPQSKGGHYKHPIQSVNYLESHDDHTMGDYIRLALGKVGKHQKINRDAVAHLSKEELKVHKLAAFTLLTSQGPVMIAQGQSWGRSKVIANSIGSDPRAGQIDHNSYEKDDETNWLNWEDKALNSELVDYYRGLIAIRAQNPQIRQVDSDYRSFFNGSHGLSFGIEMGETPEVLVLLNADKAKPSSFDLPEGTWTVLADSEHAEPGGLRKLKDKVSVRPQSGLLLVR